jgi:hypothetical protein
MKSIQRLGTLTITIRAHSTFRPVKDFHGWASAGKSRSESDYRMITAIRAS